jgi:hypothetical protein
MTANFISADLVRRIEDSCVFVFGALRSGTTVFRLMLDEHDDLTNPGEQDFLFDHLHKDPSHATGWRYDLDALQNDWIFRTRQLFVPDRMDGLDLLLCFLEQFQNGSDKLLTLNIHRNAEQVIELAPNIRMIHILRDPRDVARSSVNMGWAATMYHGVDHWIETEENWDRAVSKIRPENVHTLTYEDLFLKNEETLRGVTDFLGVSFTDKMLDYHESSTYAPPDAKLVEQWRDKAETDDVGLLESKALELMEERGYDLSGHTRVPGGLEAQILNVKNKLGVWHFGAKRFGPATYFGEKIARKTGLTPLQRKLSERIDEVTIDHVK